MAKRTKKMNSRSRLKLEALEQRQLLAGITGSGNEVLTNVVHTNGNVYDQVLMTGSTVTVTADAGQVTRVSFLDLDGDIVQAEFSGAGTLTISLDADTFKGPAAAANYNQPGVLYVQGLASFTIQGSDSSTNFGVFTVGSGTAHNGASNPIFDGGKTGGDHTADVARLTIVANPLNPNGSTFGGIRASNAEFSDSKGTVGVAATNVHVQDVVRIGDIDATGTGTPTLIFGAASQFSEIAVGGGDLLSTNNKAINNIGSYLYGISLNAGAKSDGTAIAAANSLAQLTFTGQNPVQAQSNTFTLGTGTDTVLGTKGDDSIVGGPGTLTALDNINGDDGNDTLTLTDASQNAYTLPTAITVKNVENLVINHASDNAGDALTANVNSWTGLQTVTVSQLGTNAPIDIDTKGNATSVSITGGSTVNIDDNAGTDTLASVSLNGNTGAAVLVSDALTKVSLANINNQATTVTNGTVGGHALSLTLNKVTNGADITDATATSVAITGTGSASTVSLITAASESLTLAGTTKVTLDGNSNFTALKSVTVSGSAGLVSDLSGAGALTTVDTSGTTGASTVTLGVNTVFTGGAGADKVTVAAAAKSITLGAGNDTLTLTAAPVAGTVLGGGDGTDTFAISYADYNTVSGYSTTNLAKITGFEVLSITGAALADGDNVNVGAISGLTSAQILGVVTTKAATISNLGANTSVTIKGDLATDDGALTIQLKDNTGTSDVLNLTLDHAFAQNADTTVDQDATKNLKITANGIETVNITSSGTRSQDVPVGAVADFAVNVVTLKADAVTTVNIAGSQQFSFISDAASNLLNTVDASANTAGGMIDVSAAAKSVTVTGTAQNDMIDGSNKADTINGGAGDDIITGSLGADTLTGGAGKDVFVYNAANESDLVNLDVITDFTANTYGTGTNGAAGNGAFTGGGDFVNNLADRDTMRAKWTGDVIVLDGTGFAITQVSVQSNAADAQTFLQNLGTSTNDRVGAALDSSTGRLYLDLDSNGTVDSVIQLTGVTTLTAAAFLLV